MTGDLSAVSEWGGVGRAILALLIRDLALQGSRGIVSEIPDRYLGDELLSITPDHPFFEQLLRDAGTRYTPIDGRSAMAHAVIACNYARRSGWPQWRKFLPLIFGAGERAGDVETRRTWAGAGLEGDDVDPLSRALCHETLGRCLYDEGRFAQARVELEQAVDIARETGDSITVWRAMTAIVASCQLQEDHLTALDWVEEAEVVARALDDPASLAKTLTDRGNIELNLGNYGVAAGHYREALAAAERADAKLLQANALGNLGNASMLAEDVRAAEEYGRRALAISIEIEDRESEQLDRHNLAQALHILQRDDEAIDMERHALRIAHDRNDDKADHYRKVLQRWYVDVGELAAARALEEPANDAETDDEVEGDTTDIEGGTVVDEPEGKLDPAVQEAMRAGDFKTAETLARRAVNARGEDWEAWYQLGVVLSQADRDEDAVRAYDVALQRNRLATRALFNQINARRRLGQLETALDQLSAAVEDDPLDAMARAGLGRVYAFLERYDDAIRALQESVRLRPAQVTRLALAQSLTSKATSLLRKDFDRGWAVFEEAVSVFRDLLDDYREGGELFIYAGMAFHQFADTSYKVNPPLTAGMPQDELILFGHAVSYYDRALEILGEAPIATRGRAYCLDVASAIGEPRELALAAQRLAEQGIREVPLAFLKAAIEREERSGEPHYQLAMLLWRDMERDVDPRQVEPLLAEAVRREPQNEKFAEALRVIRQPKSTWRDMLKRRLSGEQL